MAIRLIAALSAVPEAVDEASFTSSGAEAPDALIAVAVVEATTLGAVRAAIKSALWTAAKTEVTGFVAGVSRAVQIAAALPAESVAV